MPRATRQLSPPEVIEPYATEPKPPWSIDQLDRRVIEALVDNPGSSDEELARILREAPEVIYLTRIRPVVQAEIQREQRERSRPLAEMVAERKTKFFRRACELSSQDEDRGVAADMTKFLLKNDMDALAPPKKLAVSGDSENPLKVLVEVIGG